MLLPLVKAVHGALRGGQLDEAAEAVAAIFKALKTTGSPAPAPDK